MFKVTCCFITVCECNTSVQGRVLDALEGAKTQFSQILSKYIYCSLAAGEPADTTLTTQM
jgi:hypothetical protein